MLDEITIYTVGGSGGHGAVSFRRERYVPRGGPDGGDGGKGGDVIVEAVASVRGIDGLYRSRVVRAEAGRHGRSGKRHGRNGADRVVRVPVGTVVWQVDGKRQEIADLCEAGMTVVVARGGVGGRGNVRLATATRRGPRIAEKGLVGQRKKIWLELRLLAEVGLIGLPNAGKSSLLRAVSRARPKVGAYPFTTLEPCLGLVEVGYETVVMADIPGLIEGAHEGAGLGIRFLQHVRRTRVLVHVVDTARPNPLEDIEVVRTELREFGHELDEKRWVVALNKIDLAEGTARGREVASRLRAKGIETYRISARTGEGLSELLEGLVDRVREERAVEVKSRLHPARQTLKPAAARRAKVVRVGAGFEVRAEKATQIVAMLGVESEEARAEVARRLRRIGVISALRRAGAQPGDRVRIGETELEWPL